MTDNILVNKQGLPVKKENSKQIRAEQRHWKKAVQERRCTKYATMSYWQKMSTCATL